jgi:hypothetical protein
LPDYPPGGVKNNHTLAVERFGHAFRKILCAEITICGQFARDLEQVLPYLDRMETTNLPCVSFVGGPYDGCVSPRPAQQEFSGQIAMPVSANILNMLSGKAACDARPIRVVALYRLVLTPRGRRYRFHSFHRIEGAESTELTAWHHALLRAWNKILHERRQ